MKNRIALFLLAAVIATAGSCACKPIKDIAEVGEIIKQDLPSAKDTLTSLIEINHMINEAMSRGETELTFNATGIDEQELKVIGTNLSTFWGKPVRFSINSIFEGIEGIIPGQAVDVQNITNYFELSDNYYVYAFIRNGKPIPEDRPYAKEIASWLPSIASDIFPDPAASDYNKALAAHDWLVANIHYGDASPGTSDENNSYGAIAMRRTMCQGYAEAFELLLRCYTDVEVVQIVGEALNFLNEAVTDTDDTAADDGAWGGHAWNAVKMDGAWYQVDTTFDDPKGNPEGQVSHFYFGQTDTVMSKNHRWTREYFPVSDTENFLYFRQSGLFAEDWNTFQAILTGLLTEAPIGFLEIAVVGATIDENNIQFTYQVRLDLEEIWWHEQKWEDIHVLSIEFIYS